MCVSLGAGRVAEGDGTFHEEYVYRVADVTVAGRGIELLRYDEVVKALQS